MTVLAEKRYSISIYRNIKTIEKENLNLEFQRKNLFTNLLYFHPFFNPLRTLLRFLQKQRGLKLLVSTAFREAVSLNPKIICLDPNRNLQNQNRNRQRMKKKKKKNPNLKSQPATNQQSQHRKILKYSFFWGEGRMFIFLQRLIRDFKIVQVCVQLCRLNLCEVLSKTQSLYIWIMW